MNLTNWTNRMSRTNSMNHKYSTNDVRVTISKGATTYGIIYLTLLFLACVFGTAAGLPVSADGAITPDAYETDDTYSQARPITVDGTNAQVHNFHVKGDEDWVSIYAISGQTYKIKVAKQGLNCDGAIELFYSDGKTLVVPKVDDWKPSDHQDEILEWKAGTDGVYFARITNGDQTANPQDTSYELSVSRPIAPGGLGLINGTVQDSATGLAISGAVMKTGYQAATLSKPDGTYEIQEAVGDYTLTITADCYVATTQKVTFKMGSTTDPANTYNIKMTPSTGSICPRLAITNQQGTSSVNVSIALNPGSSSGTNADWWLVYVKGSSIYSLDAVHNRWTAGLSTAYQGPVFSLPASTFSVTNLPTGKYTFYLGLDTSMNGVLDTASLVYRNFEVNIP
ncbi:MAG: carboxypeptidase regulatory-like domain-containing protein [Nitrospirae bacterium]|nr:carboxypeptidase regulatory-like domain-containing protein [Nitrospirota bacterium]